MRYSFQFSCEETTASEFYAHGGSQELDAELAEEIELAVGLTSTVVKAESRVDEYPQVDVVIEFEESNDEVHEEFGESGLFKTIKAVVEKVYECEVTQGRY